MTQLPYEFSAPLPPIAHDRRTGLIVFGTFALVIGGMAACFAIFTPLAVLMASAIPQGPAAGGRVQVQGAQVDARSIVSAVVVYGVVAAAFIAGGIGSIRTRRWARPLMLSVGWTWLLVGVFGMVMMIALLPSMTEMMSAGVAGGGRAPPAGFAQGFMWIMMAISAVLYIVLPGAFILFYRSRHVRTTLEHYDSIPGWSDRAPVSVFGLAVALAVTALLTVSMAGYAAFPLFNRMLTGPAGVAATCLFAALLLLAAVLVFRLQMSGWWLTMAISILLPVSMIVSMRTIGVIAMYEHMGMPPEQLDPLRDNALMRGPLMPVATALFGIAGVVYLVAVRKSFVASAGSEERGMVTSVT